MNNLTTPTGSVPEFLGLLRNLRYLNLSYMSFTGRVPSSLGNLSKLHYLDLSDSPFFLPWRYYKNYLYSTDISWLSNMPLRHLNMGSVNLSTALDWAHVVNMIPSLKILRLTDCSLASANQSLPFLNLTGLEELSLSGNYLHNPVASCWLWNLTRLQNLNLRWNDFFGQIPDALGTYDVPSSP
jgi:Leucine-rich repeat (LRR) protein